MLKWFRKVRFSTILLWLNMIAGVIVLATATDYIINYDMTLLFWFVLLNMIASAVMLSRRAATVFDHLVIEPLLKIKYGRDE